MSTDRDDALARRYREASAALDEQPSAATRAAILAAAARQVEARPRPADAPRVLHRPRWPLAAAAAVLLSTLAVMMANRTEEEMPAFTASSERAPAAVAVAPAPTVAASPSSGSAVPPDAEAPVSTAKRSATSAAREERASVPAALPERGDAQRSDTANAVVSAREAERAAEAASDKSTQASSAAPPAAPHAPPQAAALARSAPAAAGAIRAPDIAAGKPEASSLERAPAREAAPAPQGMARLNEARDFEGSAPLWLERIVKLRREGREAEADTELKHFRERYPDVRVPAAAMPGGTAAGTR